MIIFNGDRCIRDSGLIPTDDLHDSGSDRITYQRDNSDERCVSLAFETAEKLGGDCVALDFVFDASGHPRFLEISFGFTPEGYDPCIGYWDKDINWTAGPFHPKVWMVEKVLSALSRPKQS